MGRAAGGRAWALSVLEAGRPLLADRHQALAGILGLEVLGLLAGLELQLVLEARSLAPPHGPAS